jgi:5-methylcytosine-specific restriction enzyme A
MTTRNTPAEWDWFYKTARWKRLRKHQLGQHPLCKFCLEHGIVTVANVVDHVVPHKGDWNAFGKLQSLCEPCHKSAKRQIELLTATGPTLASTAIRSTRTIRSICGEPDH